MILNYIKNKLGGIKDYALSVLESINQNIYCFNISNIGKDKIARSNAFVKPPSLESPPAISIEAQFSRLSYSLSDNISRENVASSTSHFIGMDIVSGNWAMIRNKECQKLQRILLINFVIFFLFLSDCFRCCKISLILYSLTAKRIIYCRRRSYEY